MEEDKVLTVLELNDKILGYVTTFDELDDWENEWAEVGGSYEEFLQTKRPTFTVSAFELIGGRYES